MFDLRPGFRPDETFVVEDRPPRPPTLPDPSAEALLRARGTSFGPGAPPLHALIPRGAWDGRG